MVIGPDSTLYIQYDNKSIFFATLFASSPTGLTQKRSPACVRLTFKVQVSCTGVRLKERNEDVAARSLSQSRPNLNGPHYLQTPSSVLIAVLKDDPSLPYLLSVTYWKHLEQSWYQRTRRRGRKQTKSECTRATLIMLRKVLLIVRVLATLTKAAHLASQNIAHLPLNQLNQVL